MKKLIFSLLVLCLLVSSVIALSVSFTPTYLKYNLKKGETDCKYVSYSFSSGSENIYAKFGNRASDEWKLSNFKFKDKNVGLKVLIKETDKGAEVCITRTSTQKTTKGALFIESQKEGNSVVRIVIWILVN